jgi:hypothetical protein
VSLDHGHPTDTNIPRTKWVPGKIVPSRLCRATSRSSRGPFAERERARVNKQTLGAGKSRAPASPNLCFFHD